MLRWIGNALLVVGSACGAATWAKPTQAEQVMVVTVFVAGILLHIYDVRRM